MTDTPDFKAMARELVSHLRKQWGTGAIDVWWAGRTALIADALREVDAKAFERGRASRDESFRVIGEQSITNGELVVLHEAENAGLRSQVTSLTKERNRLKRLVDDALAGDACAALRSQIATLTQERDEASDTNQMYNFRIQGLENSNIEFWKRIAALERENAELRAKIGKYQALDADNLGEALNRAVAEIAELRAKLAERAHVSAQVDYNEMCRRYHTERAARGVRDEATEFYEQIKPPGAKRTAELSEAARDVLAERERQKSAEGWTEEHDDTGEDSDSSRKFHAMQADHAQALIREEEKGYERGMRDMEVELRSQLATLTQERDDAVRKRNEWEAVYRELLNISDRTARIAALERENAELRRAINMRSK